MISKAGMNFTNGLKRSLLSKKVTNMTVSDLAKVWSYTIKINNNSTEFMLAKDLRIDRGGKKFGKWLNNLFKWGRQTLTKKNPAILKEIPLKKVVKKGKFNRNFIFTILKKDNLPKNATIGDMLEMYFKKINK